MLDLFIIGAILITLYKVCNPFHWQEYIRYRVKRFRKLQNSLLFALIDDKGGVHMKKTTCDKCNGKGCTKCAGAGHFHFSGECTDNCPEYCVKKVFNDKKYMCLGGACTPNQDMYDKLRPYLEILRT